MSKTTAGQQEHRQTQPSLDVMGPRIVFLVRPGEAGESYCMMHGIIHAGAVVPLHSHEDVESFYVLSGVLEILRETAEGYRWITATPGDSIHIVSGAKHAWRNTSASSASLLITTTPKMGRFFEEIGVPAEWNAPTAPSPTRIRQLMETAARYGYWLAGPQDNAAIGLMLPV